MCANFFGPPSSPPPLLPGHLPPLLLLLLEGLMMQPAGAIHASLRCYINSIGYAQR